jgi:hypothetical protein
MNEVGQIFPFHDAEILEPENRIVPDSQGFLLDAGNPVLKPRKVESPETVIPMPLLLGQVCLCA